MTTLLTLNRGAVALLALSLTAAAHGEEERSADEVAKELSNPAGSLASLNFNLQYITFDGNLPGAGGRDAWSVVFQPTLPVPVGDKGRRIIFRPAIPLLFDQPVFDARSGRFRDADTDLGDAGFDLVYAGNEVTDKAQGKGYLWGIGAAGTLPTATGDDVAGNQWRFGPEWLFKFTATQVVKNALAGPFK